MPESHATSYDAVHYPGAPHLQTHPDRLGVVATVFGMQPAPTTRCKVLEIGCGDGMNLIGMALGLPDSRFVGVDLAAAGIVKGQRACADLGLKNVELRQLDLMTLNEPVGSFDYIIAHGVFSWVPPPVQDRLLEVCQASLASQGVAYISYNVYPGCYVRQMLRETLRFHVRAFDTPDEKINQARTLARFLADAQVGDEINRQFYKEELEKVVGHGDHLLYHDDLADINAPSWFSQFVTHAARHGLQYLGDADYCEMQDIFYPKGVTDALRKLSRNQVLVKEQYLDFIKCRRFRRTLLCHENLELNRDPQPELAKRFHVSSSAAPVSPQPELISGKEEEFKGRAGGSLKTNQPVLKAVLFSLSKSWPGPMSFADLQQQVQAILGPDDRAADTTQATDDQALGNLLMHSYATGLVHFHLHVPRFAARPSPRPLASPLVRWQIRHDYPTVTNLFHAVVDMEDTLGRELISNLDGTRDRGTLVNDLTTAVQEERAELQEQGQPVHDPARISQIIANDLEHSLDGLARLGLLVE